jgi:hypothetical protein
MTILYTISIIILTLILNVTLTWSTPFIKVQWKLFISGIKRALKRKPKPIIDATQYIELSSRIDELEKQYKQRQTNFKSRVREEVIEYLKQLKK